MSAQLRQVARGLGKSLSAGLFWLLIVASAVLAAAVVVRLEKLVGFGVDFNATLYAPASRIVDGLNPYPSPESVTRFSFPAVYPPPAMLVAVPFTLLPLQVAAGISCATMLGTFSFGLWLCGVRDLRVFAVALVTLPSASALASGNVSMLVAGLAAITWAHRDQRAGSAALAGSLCLKPMLWPLLVWLILTGRRARAVRAFVAAALVVLLAWASIGFAGLGEFPSLLERDASAQALNGLLLVHLLVEAGVSVHGAAIVGVTLGACFVFVCLRYGDDLDVFTACILMALLSSPLLFVHYVLLLVVPLAVRRPRLCWPWFALFALWPIWRAYTEDATRPMWTVLLTAAVCVALVTGASSWGFALDRLTTRRSVLAEAS